MSDILTQTDGPAARLRLNRPKALHALNTAMCQAMLDALDAWEHDDAVHVVLLDHAEGRGFCAGGDIRMIADSGASDGAAAADFFRAEYRLNHRLFTYPKPIIAFADGIVMGGGVGISQPARYRVATENTKFAMPETGIGLFPDVGGGWYLSRLPGRMGEYLALTGHRLDGAECLALGLATHYLPAEALDSAKAQIASAPDKVLAILTDLSIDPPIAKILAHYADIDRLFAGDSVEAIFAAIEAEGSDWATATLATLRTKSPQACKVSLRIVREGRNMTDFAAEMVQEYAVATRVCRLPDFAEGVRAVILDKDNNPRWSPSTPEAVDSAAIDAIFVPLPPAQAWAP
jgi:enoyl-CoA hydratase